MKLVARSTTCIFTRISNLTLFWHSNNSLHTLPRCLKKQLNDLFYCTDQVLKINAVHPKMCFSIFSDCFSLAVYTLSCKGQEGSTLVGSLKFSAGDEAPALHCCLLPKTVKKVPQNRTAAQVRKVLMDAPFAFCFADRHRWCQWLEAPR